MAVVSIVLIFASYPIVKSISINANTNTLLWLDQMRLNLRNAIKSNKAWGQTLNEARNIDLQCLVNSSTCTSFSQTDASGNNPGNIPILIDQTGKVILDNTTGGVLDTTKGFTLQGQPCTGFSYTDGSDTCPIRVTVQWMAMCTTDCIQPEVRVQGNFVFHAKTVSNLPLTVTKFGFRIYRSSIAATDSATCATQGGTWVNPVYDGNGNIVTPGQCQIGGLPSGTCPPGQAIIGYNSLNQPTCQSIGVTYQCPNDPVYPDRIFIQGFDANGNAICVLPQCP